MGYSHERPLRGEEYNLYKRCGQTFCSLLRNQPIDECKQCQIRVLIQQTLDCIGCRAKERQELCVCCRNPFIQDCFEEERK